MRKLAEGDRVRISGRDATPADVKSQLFFPHYRNLSGTLTKLFADNTAVVTVEPSIRRSRTHCRPSRIG